MTELVRIDRPDERRWFLLCVHGYQAIPRAWPRNLLVTAPCPPPEKRALAWMSKWERRGLWESGVSTITGWPTPAGLALAASLPPEDMNPAGGR